MAVIALSKSAPDKYLSKTERLYFDALATYDTIKNAAQHLKVDPQTLYNWKLSMKKKYKQRRGWVNAVVSNARRSKSLHDILPQKPVETEEEEEEE